MKAVFELVEAIPAGVIAWLVVFACAYLALFVALWASECRAAWKRIHTARREMSLLCQRAKLERIRK
jgi:hypothetical protein